MHFETDRLIIRDFVADDLDAIHHILNQGFDANDSRETIEHWLTWTRLNYAELARMYQPPYGDRAVVLKGSERLIGAVGFVPSLGPFGQLHYFSLSKGRPIEHYNTPAFGLYWVIEKPYRGHGYATEAAHAMIRYAFDHLNMAYIVATTAYDNEGSQAVMRKLGMKIERNPFPEPEWFQVVGILENDRF